MKPIDFREADFTLRRPEGVPEEECCDLRVCRTSDGVHELVISCWRGSWRDRLRFLWTGKIWFTAWGITHPPILISTERPFLE
jgi:hypothetical protein